jgi:hypothetical protein
LVYQNADADQESGCQSFEIAQQVSTALGRLFRYVEKSWIFDNEIDWVLRIKRVSPYQAGRKAGLKGCDAR